MRKEIFIAYISNKTIYRRMFWISSHVIRVSDLKHMKIGVITLLLFGMVIGLTGIVFADRV